MFNRRDLVMTGLGLGGGDLVRVWSPDDKGEALPRLPVGDSAQLDGSALPHGLAVVDESGLLRIGDGETPGGRRMVDSGALQTFGPAAWDGPVEDYPIPVERPDVQALVAAAAPIGAPLLLRPGQTAFIDVGPSGHFPISRLQDAIRLQEAWGGGPAVRIRLAPGQHELEKGVRASQSIVTWIEGARGRDGKLWRDVAITSLSVAVAGPKDPALPKAIQITRITVGVASLEGISVGGMVRLQPSSPGDLAEQQLADGCAGCFAVESVDAAARSFTALGRHYGPAEFPAFPAGGLCRVAHSTLRVGADFRSIAFSVGTDARVGAPSRLHLNLALDISRSRHAMTTGVLVFYGGSLSFDPDDLSIYGGPRTGIWVVGGAVSGFGLCISGASRNIVAQQGYNLQLFRGVFTQAESYAVAASADGVLTAALSQAHGGVASLFASDGSAAWMPGAKISGGRWGAYAQQGARIRIEGHATPGRSYVGGQEGAVQALGFGPFGSTVVRISGTTDFRNPRVSVAAGGMLLGESAAPLRGVAAGVVTREGGWLPTINDMPDVMSALDLRLHVHQTEGDDATGDGSRARPFRSIRQAIRTAPPLAALTVALLSDYVRGETELEASLARPLSQLRIVGVSATARHANRTLTLTNFLFPDEASYGAGFLAAPREHGRLAVAFEFLTIRFPAPPGGARRTRGYQDGLVGRTVADLGPPDLFVGFRSTTFEREAGATGLVIASPYGKRALWADAVIHGPDMAGRWVAGVAAGAAPDGNVVSSNLATL